MLGAKALLRLRSGCIIVLNAGLRLNGGGSWLTELSLYVTCAARLSGERKVLSSACGGEATRSGGAVGSATASGWEINTDALAT